MSFRDIVRRNRQKRAQENQQATAHQLAETAKNQSRNTASFRSIAVVAENDDKTLSGKLPNRDNAAVDKIANFGDILPGQSGLMLTPEGDYNRGSSTLFLSPWLSTDEESP